jgi:hypothetical protein
MPAVSPTYQRTSREVRMVFSERVASASESSRFGRVMHVQAGCFICAPVFLLNNLIEDAR